MSARFVLGLGGTVDYEMVLDAGVLQELARSHDVRADDLEEPGPIRSERELLVCILSYLARGAGGERRLESSTLIEEFAARFRRKVTLGGTGVRAGLVLESLGVPSVQHLVSVDDTVRRLLPKSMRFVCSATRDSLDPHLIVQYAAGTTVRLADGVDVVSPASNRLILADDEPNRSMAIAAGLREELAEADVFLISGFNTMLDRELLHHRLDELTAAMVELPDAALVYYEDAGYYDRSFAHVAREHLMKRIDVYGLNEDEAQEYLGRQLRLLSPDNVAESLRDLHRLIPAPALVLHTRYWAAAVGPRARQLKPALESAVLAAASRYRLGDGLSPQDMEDTAVLPRHPGGAKVATRVPHLLPGAVLVPAFDLDTPTPTTIGLGDTFVGGFLAAFSSQGN